MIFHSMVQVSINRLNSVSGTLLNEGHQVTIYFPRRIASGPS